MCVGRKKLNKTERANFPLLFLRMYLGKENKSLFFKSGGLNLDMSAWSGQEVGLSILAWQSFLSCGFKEWPISFNSFLKTRLLRDKNNCFKIKIHSAMFV